MLRKVSSEYRDTHSANGLTQRITSLEERGPGCGLGLSFSVQLVIPKSTSRFDKGENRGQV
jgi:hypothetical protein